MARVAGGVVSVVAVVGLAVTLADAGPARTTRITVWSGTARDAALGGLTYGGVAPFTGALITEPREVEVGASGEVRIGDVASTIEPGSVQLRDLTEPGATLAEQRFVPGATTPTEILARRIGAPVTVVTTKGEVAGVLRAVDEQTIVLELGTGDQRRVAVMRRDGHVLDVRAPAGADGPSLVFRIASTRRGTHAVEVSYRAAGLAWTASYLAVLDEPGKAIDFSAWATVENTSGASFARAELTLVSDGSATATRAGRPRPLRFTVPAPVTLVHGQTTQVELVPGRTGAKVKPVITYEAMPDPSAEHQDDPATDCTYNAGTGAASGRGAVALELDLPAHTTLPDGRVRLLRRAGDRLELVTEDALHVAPGVARIALEPDTTITGARRAVTCNVDERARTIHEKIEVRVDNKGPQAADVVIREYAWRWPAWKVEREDRPSVRAGPQTLEYRVRVPAKGSQVISYSLVYTW